MFWFHVVIFLMFSVISQVKYLHARETAHPARSSIRVPNKNPGWIILKDNQGRTYKYWAEKHENAASYTGDDGDMTAVIQEGDLIAMRRQRRHRPTPKKNHHTTRVPSTTTSERAKTDMNDSECQTTSEAFSPEETTVTTTTTTTTTTPPPPPPSTTTSRGHSTNGKTTSKIDKSTKPVSSSTTFRTPKSTECTTKAVGINDTDNTDPFEAPSTDKNKVSIVLGPNASNLASSSDAAGWHNSGLNDQQIPTTSVGENEDEIESNEETNFNKPCENPGRDGFILLVENNIKLKFVSESKRVEEKQWIAPDDASDQSAETECAETDKKPSQSRVEKH